MKRHLYDSALSKEDDGYDRTDSHPARASPQEFFAALSTSYFWNDDGDTQFTPWYPHNRKQLIDYDYETYEILHKIWSYCPV